MYYNPQKVIAWAISQKGYHEKATNDQLEDFLANAGDQNWNKYAAYLDKIKGFYNGLKNIGPQGMWCDIWVDCGFVVCYGREGAQYLLCQPDNSAGAGCQFSAAYYNAKGQFYKSGPKPGDQIFFGSSWQNIWHTGLVIGVTGTCVITMEGNTSNMVDERRYKLNDNSIWGYGRPDWGNPAEGETEEPEASTPGTELSGIDISGWQKGIDLSALRTDFIICKISEGTGWTDPCFEDFYKTAKVPIGAYVYSHATTPDAARAEAQKALSLLNGRKLPLGVYIDVEEGAQLSLSNSALTAVVKEFCDAIRAAGYRTGAYGSAGNLWAKVKPADLGEDVLVWVAIWGAEPRISCDIWQYSDHERLTGYSGNLDGDKAMSARFLSIVNGSEPIPEPAQEPMSGKTYEVKLPLLKRGARGAYVKTLQWLLIGHGLSCGGDLDENGREKPDGIFGEKTEEAVTNFQIRRKLLVDGEAGGETWGALHIM